MGEDLNQEREGKPKGVNGILVCLKEVNMKFSHAKMKGLVMKRNTIARSRKNLKSQIDLKRPQGHNTII